MPDLWEERQKCGRLEFDRRRSDCVISSILKNSNQRKLIVFRKSKDSGGVKDALHKGNGKSQVTEEWEEDDCDLRTRAYSIGPRPNRMIYLAQQVINGYSWTDLDPTVERNRHKPSMSDTYVKRWYDEVAHTPENHKVMDVAQNSPNRKSSVYQSFNSKHFSFLKLSKKLKDTAKLAPGKDSLPLSTSKFPGRSDMGVGSKLALGLQSPMLSSQKSRKRLGLDNSCAQYFCASTQKLSPLSPAYDYATLNDKDRLEARSRALSVDENGNTTGLARPRTLSIAEPKRPGTPGTDRRAKSAERNNRNPETPKHTK